MTKTINTLRLDLVSAGVLFVLFTTSVITAHAAVTGQMGVGSRGSNVTQLQQFLATNSQIYPEGIVSGYYGALTQAAVTQFQVAYGIEQVGNVGPITEAKINALIGSGFGLDTRAPIMSNFSISQINPGNATISWDTNKLTRGQVFYDMNPVPASEATGPYQFPWIGGMQANINSNQNMSNTHQVIQLTNLQPNTTYYYIIRSIDESGNVSMSMNQSFRTN